jgi:AcrR family transcriptional regulator
MELFAERGFKGATAERIAARAGVNKAMINYHFRTKRGLYESILASTIGDFAHRLVGLRDDARPAPVRLREFVTAFAETASRHPHFPAMLLREVASGGARVGPKIIGLIVSVFGVVREIVERGVRDGSLRPVDPALTHLSIVGSLVFFFATEPFRRRVLAGPDPPFPLPKAEDYVRHVQELISRGLAADDRASGESRGLGRSDAP